MLKPSVLWARGVWGCSAVPSGCLCPAACIPLVPVGTASLAVLDQCLQPVSPRTHGDSIPGCAGSEGWGAGRAELTGRCWRTMGLQPRMFSLPFILAGERPPCVLSCPGPRPWREPPACCSGAMPPLSPRTSCLHACRSLEGLGKGAHGWCGITLRVPPSRGREGICWGMLVSTMRVLGFSGLAKCYCPRAAAMLQGLRGRWEVSLHPSWVGLPFGAPLHCLLSLQS